MSERDDWRFQWPDGTWIRWNPRTQSWEKEQEEDLAPPEAGITEPDVADLVEQIPEPGPDISEPAPDISEPAPDISEPAPDISEPAPNLADLVPDVPDETETVDPKEPTPGLLRAGVSDVAPGEAGTKHGSLWPAVIAGAVVGITFGIVIAVMIR